MSKAQQYLRGEQRQKKGDYFYRVMGWWIILTGEQRQKDTERKYTVSPHARCVFSARDGEMVTSPVENGMFWVFREMPVRLFAHGGIKRDAC